LFFYYKIVFCFLKVYDSYKITRDDAEAINELSSWPNSGSADRQKQIDSKVFIFN
jgi:hypothetical protein